jgi:hypothetical protein
VKIFSVENDVVKPKTALLFWATIYGPECRSIWNEYGTTKLEFEQFSVIGVASDDFRRQLFNRQGRAW